MKYLKKTSSLFIHKLVHVLMFGRKRVNLQQIHEFITHWYAKI